MTLTFDGALGQDGTLPGNWQDSTARNGTIVLQRGAAFSADI